MNATTSQPLASNPPPSKAGTGTPFAAVIEISEDAFISKTPEGIITSWSPRAEKLFGYSAKEIIGKPVLILIPSDRVPLEQRLITRAAAGEGIHEFETVRIKKDGTSINVGVRLAPVKDSLGNVIGIAKIARDIDEHRQALEALRASEERFRQVVESIREVFWMLDVAQNRAIYVSPSYAEIWGQPPTKLFESFNRFAEDVHPDDRDALLRVAREKQFAGTYDETFRIIRPDGAVRWLHSKAFPVRNAAGEVYRIAGVAEDITQRKEAEDALRMPSRVLENMGEGVFVSGPDGEILFSNPASDRMFGYVRGSLVGENISSLGILPTPESLRVNVQIQQELNQTGTWTGEVSSRRRDGTTLLTLAHITALEIGGKKCAVAVHDDVTQRKQLELHLLRAQRMESLGRLASGIAHDMNNVLAPIMMAAPLLRSGLTPERADRILASIETSADRGAHLVKQLLFFGRGVEGVRNVIHLKDAVREMEAIVVQTFPKGISIFTAVPPDAWPVNADPTQIHQVLLNLCVNARDAAPDGGRLSIVVENVAVDKSYPYKASDAKAGAYVRIAVMDTGSGISPENIDKIFDPFFTTKEVGKGTGLGLSTVLGIVKNHGGFVTLESEVGRGSTFRVHLPALPEAIENQREKMIEFPPLGRNELVLVVDDEEIIRNLSSELLVEHGYKVMSAANGSEAMAAFTSQAENIRLVVTDCDMPVMDGINLVRLLRKMNPRLKIIVSTGIQSAMKAGRHSIALDDLDDIVFLPKPCTPNQLLNAVHDLLEREHVRPLAIRRA